MEINKIYNDDCVSFMDKVNDNFVDAIITSPPYNIIRPNQKDRGYDMYNDGMQNDEYIKWTINIFNKFNRILKNDGVILYNMSYGTENTTLMSLTIADIIRNTDFTLADIIIWKKQSATPNTVSHNKLTRICEYIYVLCRKTEFDTFNSNREVIGLRDSEQKIYATKYNFLTAKNNDTSTELNKATFSTELVRKLLLLYTKEGDLIYDPFMGTGTTANACIIEKRNYLGSELSSKQCEYAEKRLNITISQPTLF